MEFHPLSRAVLSDVSRCLQSVDAVQVKALVDALAASRKVFLIGSGRSGAALQAMAIRLQHLSVDALLVGSPTCPPVRKSDLVIVGSGSGETPLALERARDAHQAGASLFAITAAPTSSIAQLAARVIHVPAPITPPDSSPHTLRSLFEECLFILCDCVCRMLQEKLGVSTGQMQSRHSKRE